MESTGPMNNICLLFLLPVVRGGNIFSKPMNKKRNIQYLKYTFGEEYYHQQLKCEVTVFITPDKWSKAGSVPEEHIRYIFVSFRKNQ